MILFTDMRHIKCGDIDWTSADGRILPLVNPSESPEQIRARRCFLPSGVRLQSQRGTKVDVLPAGSRPSRISFERIIFEGRLYRSWYLDTEYASGTDLGEYSHEVPQAVYVCHVESADGFSWKKPVRCQVHLPGQTRITGLSFFIDPTGDEEERYKAVYMACPPEDELSSLWETYQKLHPRYRDMRLTSDYLTCMYGLVSPDGMNWRPIREPLLIHKSDTDTSVYYDACLRRYVMYTRLYLQERRLIARAETEDFRHWGPVEPLIWPSPEDGLSTDIYTNSRTEYPGLPEYHLMFPMKYHRYTQTSDISLFSSSDGIRWDEVPGGPVISPGLPGEWDSEFIFAGKDLMPFGNDSIGLPYYGTCFPHKYPRYKHVLESTRMGWVTWPKGRLCGIVADESGEFFTMPMVPTGREISLNVRTRLAGEVRVGIWDMTGRSVGDCDPIRGDHLACKVRWRGNSDIGVKVEQAVILHFSLRAAEVFGFEWVPQQDNCNFCR